MIRVGIIESKMNDMKNIKKIKTLETLKATTLKKADLHHVTGGKISEMTDGNGGRPKKDSGSGF